MTNDWDNLSFRRPDFPGEGAQPLKAERSLVHEIAGDSPRVFPLLWGKNNPLSQPVSQRASFGRGKFPVPACNPAQRCTMGAMLGSAWPFLAALGSTISGALTFGPSGKQKQTGLSLSYDQRQFQSQNNGSSAERS